MSRLGLGMSGHHRAIGRTNEWLTPPGIIERLGEFDLDPCSPVDRPWPTAGRHYTELDDGLGLPWEGRVWLNPPYGPETGRWLSRMAAHGNGIALIFARTETEAFHRYVWATADAILFLRGRLNFYRPDGSRSEKNSGAPSVLIAYGLVNSSRLESSGIEGKYLTINR